MHARIATAVALALAAAVTAPADAAAQADARSYAIVVGSNPGGEGQDELRYAEADAANMAKLLGDIGGYRADDVTLLSRPTAAELVAAVASLAGDIEADAAAGRQTVLLFYYSGHSRASSLNLGAEELPIATLREAITALPATLTIVILDACQSGAFSNIKGAEPAADFSFNSVSRLNAAGIAVMASSASTELSQESERLGASYFTHYLLVALRGAGDANKDGRVSLDEAYRYAYAQTLVATAKTAVGRQHVTLETDLKGKGDVALSYPAKADAHLELPDGLAADVLVTHAKSGSVMAEVHKVDDAVTLALPKGRYTVVVHGGTWARQCAVSLAPGQVARLDVDDCERVDLAATTTKGDGMLPPELWAVEAGFGFGFGLGDRYTERLQDFGYSEGFYVPVHYALAVSRRLTRHIHAVGTVSRLDAAVYNRDNDTRHEQFRWVTHGLSLSLRGEYPMAGGVLVPFAEAGAGVATATTALEIDDTDSVEDRHWGHQLTAAAGVQVMPWRRLGFFARASFVSAPVIDNLLDDTHDAGGAFFALGARGRF
jgi:hypothetical protein